MAKVNGCVSVLCFLVNLSILLSVDTQNCGKLEAKGEKHDNICGAGDFAAPKNKCKYLLKSQLYDLGSGQLSTFCALSRCA